MVSNAQAWRSASEEVVIKVRKSQLMHGLTQNAFVDEFAYLKFAKGSTRDWIHAKITSAILCVVDFFLFR